jgi:hypothetical protein
MRTLEQGARDQGRLCAAGPTLERLAPADVEHRVPSLATARTTKPLGPARALQRRLARPLGALIITSASSLMPPRASNKVAGLGAVDVGAVLAVEKRAR